MHLHVLLWALLTDLFHDDQKVLGLLSYFINQII